FSERQFLRFDSLSIESAEIPDPSDSGARYAERIDLGSSVFARGKGLAMQSSERRDFRDIVIAACRHVFPQCGFPISPDPINLDMPVGPAEPLAAFIGFSAETLRGAITLLLPVALVRSSYPLKLKSGIEADLDLFDWSGEIVNRLLGRVKAGLALRGV